MGHHFVFNNMKLLELNLAAKKAYDLQEKTKRRNQMRQWRKQPTLVFISQTDYDNWLKYTKWYKRPVTIKHSFGLLIVTFLDHKANKNVAAAA